MKIRTLQHYINEAAAGLIKNRLMSIASILTVASCIMIVSIFYALAANLEYFLRQLEESVEITVFIEDRLTAEEAHALYDKVLAIPHVLTVHYITPDKVLDDFRAMLEDDRVLEGLEKDNPFNRSFNIEIDELRNQDGIMDALRAMESEGIYRIRHSQEFTDMALAVSNGVRLVCIVLILVLGGISIIIITNTIRIAVSARKVEINIMKYVGATDWFIRWPFVIEGVLIGFFGGIIPAIICWAAYNHVVQALKDWLPVISFVSFRPDYEIFMYLFPFSLLLGTFIGVIGSATSIRRHLKV